jgi:hypothetical protein
MTNRAKSLSSRLCLLIVAFCFDLSYVTFIFIFGLLR